MRRKMLVDALPTFELEDQDGFFAGNLGGHLGEGIAIWGPDWDERVANHAPHRYRVREYRLSGATLVLAHDYFIGPRMMLGSDEAAARLGLAYRDNGPWRMAADGIWKKQP